MTCSPDELESVRSSLEADDKESRLGTDSERGKCPVIEFRGDWGFDVDSLGLSLLITVEVEVLEGSSWLSCCTVSSLG